MSNIHNNSVLQRGTTSRAQKPVGAENESNGLGSAGYFAVEKEEERQNDQYLDRSDSLMSALAGLAAINSSRLFVTTPKFK